MLQNKIQVNLEQFLHACVYLKEQCGIRVIPVHMRTDQSLVVAKGIPKRNSSCNAIQNETDMDCIHVSKQP